MDVINGWPLLPRLLSLFLSTMISIQICGKTTKTQNSSSLQNFWKLSNQRRLSELDTFHLQFSKAKGKIVQFPLIGIPRNWPSQKANSRSLRSLESREIRRFKRQTLAVSAHKDTEKLAKLESELFQSPLIGTPRKRKSLMANSSSHRSLGHWEIG